MIVTGIKCKICGEKIWSKNTHDFHWCKCHNVAVDGGRSYLKVVGGMLAATEGDTKAYDVVKIDTGKEDGS